MKSWNTPRIESISSTKCRNTATTQSMRNTRSLKYFKYQTVFQSIAPQNTSTTAVLQSIKLQNTVSMAVFAVQNLEILRVLAVSCSTQSPNTASAWNTWSIFFSKIIYFNCSQVLRSPIREKYVIIVIQNAQRGHTKKNCLAWLLKVLKAYKGTCGN